MALRGFDAELAVEIPDFDFARFAGCAGPDPHGPSAWRRLFHPHRLTHLFAAYWRARLRGVIPPGFTGLYPEE